MRGFGLKYASIHSLPGPTTRTTRSMPDSVISVTTISITGVSTTGMSSFGTARLMGRKRVPSPAAGMTPYLTGFTAGVAVSCSRVIGARPRR
jgi:hypothetical protein